MHLLKILFTTLLCCLLCQHELEAQADTLTRTQQDTTAPAIRRVLPVARRTAADSARIAATRRVQFVQDSLKRAAVSNKVTADSIIKVRVDSTAKARTDSLARKTSDSLQLVANSIKAINDSLELIRVTKLTKEKISDVQTLLASSKHFRFVRGTGESRKLQERQQADKDLLFYVLCGIVLYFAIFKVFFGKYLSNLFTLFFRVTMRQQQIREQLLQTPLPSLLLNILFVVSAGMYLNLLLFYYRLNPVSGFWLGFSYCIALVSLLYLGKLLILKAMGWIFNVSNATNTYLFIVFLVNKMIGMFLLPFIFILAFPHPVIISGMVTLSVILVIALFFYRFIISYRPIRNEINVGRLHFIIYLCAFEIAPLLLIYKVLLMFVDRNN
jgi:uncharacterized protein DUF4271